MPILTEESNATRYQITLTERQFQVVIRALDLFMRLQLGQFWVVADLWRLRRPVEALRLMEAHLQNAATEATGYTGRASPGITHPNNPVGAQIAYEVGRSLEMHLHPRSHPPLRLTSEPLPTVTTLEEPEC